LYNPSNQKDLVLFSTVAEGKNSRIRKDMQNLLSRCNAVKIPPSSVVKILGELNRASSILRDVFNDTFTSIQIDDEELYNQTKDYLQEIAPSKQSIVKFYQSNDTPILRNTT
jgi:ribonuclease G